MATILSTTLLNLFLIPSFFLALLLTPACKADNILYSGETLGPNESLEYGNSRFIIQEDCNLVLYEAGIAVWSSNTTHIATNCHLTLHTFGNLVVYDPEGSALWDSNTSGLPALRVRNVVIYGGAIWATATNADGNNATPVVSAAETIRTTLVDESEISTGI
ncbi:mannose-specific lectin-like [Magnolia sinica]|uniref:mannose-specific lectin-like n=1 Tax=Magnolia sinica TaxID=86752 RepID=UPI00265A1B99|nr:mannose-specific lectin-like [Magnolia sinica]